VRGYPIKRITGFVTSQHKRAVQLDTRLRGYDGARVFSQSDHGRCDVNRHTRESGYPVMPITGFVTSRRKTAVQLDTRLRGYDGGAGPNGARV
jgi:hypothetical protein